MRLLQSGMPRWLRLSLVAVLWALYLTAVYADQERHESLLSPATAIPILATGVLLGWRVGLSAALLNPAVTVALHMLHGRGETLAMEVGEGLPGWLIGAVVGWGSGFMADGLRRERASEERYRLLSENASDLVQAFDAGNVCTYASPSSLHVLGYAPHELVGTDGLHLLHPDDAERMRSGGFGETLPDGSHVVEVRARHKDGAWVWVETVSRPIRDASGRIRGTVAASRSISRRKEDEQALQRRETLLAQAESIADLSCWEADLRTGEAFWSEGAFRLFGLPRASPMSYEAWLACIHPEDRERAKAAADGVVDGGQPVEFECRIVRPDGQVRHTLNRTIPTVADGRVVRLTGVNQDITERKEAHLRAADVGRRLASVIAASPLPIVQADEAMRVTAWNPAAERLFGWTSAEAQGRPLFTVPESDRGRTDELNRELRDGRIVVREDVPRRRKDGSEVRVNVYLSPLVAEDGRFQGVMGIVLDLTAQKEVEAQRLKVQKLEEVTAFKTQFLNNAAHELATPLTPIKLQMAGLRRSIFGSLTPPQAEAIGLVDRNLDRLARLVQDLLDAARLQSGRLRVAHVPVQPGRIAQDVVASFAEKARQEGVCIATRGLPAGVAALGDEARLSQVLFNLVHNAFKFTPRGGRVEVALEPSGGDVVLTVSDTGAGLTQEQIGRLFQPFTQVHDAALHNVGGTGLGLYISQGIVEQHGGRIACRSGGPGRGTTFEVRIPVAAGSVPPAPAAQQSAARMEEAAWGPRR